MRAVLVSDLHLTGLADPTQSAFVSWLDELAADHLYLLGDVFHHWWGFSGGVATAYVPACAALLRLRSRGVALTVIPGNHDFALGPFFRETLGASVQEAHLITLDGMRYHLAHGDEADRSQGYLLVRGVLRSRAFAAGMRLVGPARGFELLQRLAGARRDEGVASAAVLQAQERWAEEAFSRGAEIVVLGHTHAPGITQLPGGTLIRLGDWREGPVWLSVEDGRPTLHGVPPR